MQFNVDSNNIYYIGTERAFERVQHSNVTIIIVIRHIDRFLMDKKKYKTYIYKY